MFCNDCWSRSSKEESEAADEDGDGEDAAEVDAEGEGCWTCIKAANLEHSEWSRRNVLIKLADWSSSAV